MQRRVALTLILLAGLTLASSATVASASLPGTATKGDRAAWRTLLQLADGMRERLADR